MTRWGSVSVASSSSGSSAIIAPEDLSMVHLNNWALSCFLQRDFDQAKEHLQKAYELCLRKLRTSPPPSTVSFPMSLIEPDEGITGIAMMIDDDEQETSTTAYIEKQPCHDHIPMNPSLDAERMLLRETNGATNLGNEDGSSVYPGRAQSQSIGPGSGGTAAVYTMYNRALVLSSPEVEDPHMIVRTRAVLLYNLALVHHNIGIHHGVSSSLWEALRYYELALDILDRHIPREYGPDGSMSNTALIFAWRMLNVDKLVLAILNNMGNIHAHLFHLENTQACMESLRMVLEASVAVSSIVELTGNDGGGTMGTVDGNEMNSTPLTMSEDFIFFLLNSIFQGKELLLAAAA